MADQLLRRCIFCLKVKPHDQFDPEHVFPEAIGGTLEIRTVCRGCNSSLGHDVDGPFANIWFVQMKRALLGIGGKTGTIPNPFARGVVAGDPEQKVRTVLDGEGNVEPHYVPRVRSVRLSDHAERIRMSYDASDKNEIPEAINKMLRRRGLPELSTEAILATLKTQSATPAIEMSISVDLKIVHRELLKIAYELATDWLGADYIEDPAAPIVRSCILAKPKDVGTFGNLDAAEHLGAQSWGRDVTSHIAWLTVSSGCVRAYVRVFDVFQGTFDMSTHADRYMLPGGKFVAIDPVTGAIRASSLEDEMSRMGTQG